MADANGKKVCYALRFPDQMNSEGGLYYNYFRDYDPSTGSYVQSDPIGLAGGLNTYAYVGGNPLSYVDPLGLFEIFGTDIGSRRRFDGSRTAPEYRFGINFDGADGFIAQCVTYTVGSLGKGARGLFIVLDLIDSTEVGPKVNTYFPQNAFSVMKYDEILKKEFSKSFGGKYSTGTDLSSPLTRLKLEGILESQFASNPKLRDLYGSPYKMLNQVEININNTWDSKLKRQ